MFLGTVAIVGAPNVGKSTLFNRIIRFQKSIVYDTPGTTRDRIYGEAKWLENYFFIIDTGGIEQENNLFQKQIEQQARIAIKEADAIIFLVNGKNNGLSLDDKRIMKMLLKSNKKIFLVVNKIDNLTEKHNINAFYSYGLTPYSISSMHAIGIGDLLEDIVNFLKTIKKSIDHCNDAISFSIIGRQNVGKSTLLNALTKKDNVIVSDVPGTTRDAIDIAFIHNKQKYIIIDTPGLKKRGKIFDKLDKLSAFKTFQSIAKSDVILFVIDVSEGIVKQDKHIAGYIFNNAKAVIIIVNKCDVEKKINLDNIRSGFKFLHFANVVFVSALTGKNINKIFYEINIAYQNLHKKIIQSDLNEIFFNIVNYNEPPIFKGGRIKFFSIKQDDLCFPTFVLEVNDERFMHFSYMRYIENSIRKSFPFTNVMLKIILKNRKIL